MLLRRTNEISDLDITIFLKQFATLMSADIPIIECCDILSKCQNKKLLQVLILSIKNDILSGASLFSSLRRHTKHFDALTCRLIQIGEQTGKLDTMLHLSATHHEKQHHLKRRIKQALFYPCIVTTVALIIAICMFVFIIPKFEALFSESHVQLPFITTLIFKLSTYLRHYFGVMILISTLIAFFLHRYQQNKINILQNVALYMPIVKVLLIKISLLRFARQFTLTLSAGIPITHALTLTANACTHINLTHAILELNRKVNAGSTLHQAMTTLPTFPVLMTQMVRIGEESGMLGNMLNKFADFIENEIEQLIERSHQLLEPLIMVVLGVLIGGLVIGMYLPIFKLGSTI